LIVLISLYYYGLKTILDNYVEVFDLLTNSLESTSTNLGNLGGDNNPNPGGGDNNPNKTSDHNTSKAESKKEKLERYKQKKANNPGMGSGNSSV
jgi:hypothetical protein